MNKFRNVFSRVKGSVIGMIHVRALPGSPKYVCGMREIIETACKEADMYKEANFDGLLLENMFDVPWSLLSDASAPEITAAMTAVSYQVRKCCPHLPIGIQILSSANRQALAVAKAAGLNFIRAEGYIYSHIADEGLVNACAGDLLRYRKQIDADDILIFTDIKKKHSSHSITLDVDLVETAQAAELFSSDGIILTGRTTGDATDSQQLQEVQKAVDIPVLVGSGVNEENVQNYINANAMIVGSHFKVKGHWVNELDWDRTNSFMNKVRTLRGKGQ